ncbi:MAG: FAD binding domain-containing protein [Candidatus Muiribacteriota bacterium]
MKNFDFFKFNKLGETLEFLRKTRNNSKIIAGGTDLIIELRKNSKNLGTEMDKVIDISTHKELSQISDENKDFLEIGACCTHTQISSHPLVKKNFPALAAASNSVGCLQTRNTGTIGGNIVNSSPSGDTLPALTAYEAVLYFEKDGGICREIPVSSFIKGPYKNQIEPDEILYSILLYYRKDNNPLYSYQKLGRRNALSITRISICALCDLEDKKMKNIRIVPGAVLPYFRRIYKAESFLEGKEPSDKLFKEAAALISEDVFEEVGQRWSTPYKKPVLNKLAYAALKEMITFKEKVC